VTGTSNLSPSQLVEQVRSRYGDAIPDELLGIKAPGFEDDLELALERAKKFKYDLYYRSLIEAMAVQRGHMGRCGPRMDRMLRRVLKHLIPRLPAPTRSDVSKRVAVGCINRSQPSALVVKSGESCAILINGGLIRYLSMYCVYSIAYDDPSAVRWCAVKRASAVTSGDIDSFSYALYSNYHELGRIVAPGIRLRRGEQRAASHLVAMAMTFAVAHEVGHYLLGHLEPHALEEEPFTADTARFMQEFAADAFAVDVVTGKFVRGSPSTQTVLTDFLGLNHLFHVLEETEPIRGCLPGEKFQAFRPPAPRLRMVQLANYLFGLQGALLWEQTYGDVSKLGAFTSYVVSEDRQPR
jgi:hypothetical protein